MKHLFTTTLLFGSMILCSSLSVNASTELKMVKANEFTGATKAQQGTDLGKGYTGKGVVIAIIDDGFDVDHPAFWDAEGKSRVKAYVNLDSRVFTENIKAIIKSEEHHLDLHGTHVAGIAAGASPKVQGQYRDYAGVLHDNVQIPFSGVAPDAEIVFVYVVDKAYYQTAMAAVKNYANGRPVVFNISAGENKGWHDGLDYRALTNYIKDDGAIVCVAAGNEGQQNLAVSAEAGVGETVTKIFPLPLNSGAAQLYMMSNINAPILAELVAFNKNTKEEIYSIELTDNLKLGTYGSTGGGTGGSSGDVLGGEAWEKVFAAPTSNTNGWVRNISGSSTECYKYEMSFNYVPKDPATVVGIRVKVSDGEKVMATLFPVNKDKPVVFPEPEMDGWVASSPDGSITTLSTVPGVISVGACSSADAHPMLENESLLSNSTKAGEVWPMTSYGSSMSNDEKLPHVCAPGVDIISAYNNNNTDSDVRVSSAFVSLPDLSRYEYTWGPMTGTSMATPYVAGTIALWLEANPNLTTADIKDLIAETSTKKEGDPRWGAGIINPYEGLRKILGLSSVNEVAEHEPMINVTDNGIEVITDGKAVTVELYDLSGRLVASKASQTNEAAISTESLTGGVYVLRINDGANSISRKIVTK